MPEEDGVSCCGPQPVKRAAAKAAAQARARARFFIENFIVFPSRQVGVKIPEAPAAPVL